jgi:ABC-type transport system involved in cytochrome bd biosynthesis fused ATPase/permease subunit
MNDKPRSALQRLPQQVDLSVGLPLVVIVFAGVAVLALLVGLFSPAGGFAFLVLGLLATVIIDTMMFQQQGEDAADKMEKQGPG